MTDSARPGADTASSRVARAIQSLSAVRHLGTWIGVVLVGAGGVLLFVAWAKTAALDNVALQMPYVISAGFTGLGLIAVGLTVVNIAAKRDDARERTRQAAELAVLLAELRRAIETDRAT
jgi:hypothetical protein